MVGTVQMISKETRAHHITCTETEKHIIYITFVGISYLNYCNNKFVILTYIAQIPSKLTINCSVWEDNNNGKILLQLVQ